MKFIRNKGFSLVEIMVVLVIMVLIFSIVAAGIAVWRITHESEESSIKIQEDARRAMNFMSRELRNALAPDPSQINFNLSVGNWQDESDLGWSNSIEFKLPVYVNNDGMNINIAKPDAGADMIYVETVVDDFGNVDKGAYLLGETPSVFDGSEYNRIGRSIKYILEDSKIIRRIFDSSSNAIAGEDTILADNVAFLGFMRKSLASPRVIIIRIRLQKNIFPERSNPAINFSTIGRTTLRNYGAVN